MTSTPYVFISGYVDDDGEPSNVLFQSILEDTIIDASMVESFFKRHNFAFTEIFNLRDDEVQYYVIDERVALTANQIELMKAK